MLYMLFVYSGSKCVLYLSTDPVVQFSLTAYTVREGDFPFSVNIDLLPAPSEDITLTICFISDTAVGETAPTF